MPVRDGGEALSPVVKRHEPVNKNDGIRETGVLYDPVGEIVRYEEGRGEVHYREIPRDGRVVSVLGDDGVSYSFILGFGPTLVATGAGENGQRYKKIDLLNRVNGEQHQRGLLEIAPFGDAPRILCYQEFRLRESNENGEIVAPTAETPPFENVVAMIGHGLVCSENGRWVWKISGGREVSKTVLAWQKYAKARNYPPIDFLGVCHDKESAEGNMLVYRRPGEMKQVVYSARRSIGVTAMIDFSKPNYRDGYVEGFGSTEASDNFFENKERLWERCGGKRAIVRKRE